MAKKSPPSPPEDTRLLRSRAEIEEKLDLRIKEGEALEAEQINSDDGLKAARERYYAWSSYNSTLLKKLFSGEEVLSEYSGPGFAFGVFGGNVVLSEEIQKHFRDVHRKVASLRIIKSKVELYE